MGELLDHIEDRLYDRLAEKSAAKLGVYTALLPAQHKLNDVVCRFLASRGSGEEAHTRLRDAPSRRFAPRPWPSPPAHRRSAGR